MTSKTVLVAVVTVAIGLSVQAASWFDTKISQYTGWPTTGVADMGGAWSNPESATLVNKALELDTEANSPLTFAATDAKTLADTSTNMTFTASLDFTPFASVAGAAVPSDAKVGVIAVKDAGDTTKVQYYVLAKDPDGATNVWTVCGSAVTAPEGPVTVVIGVDANGVSYKIGEAEAVVVTAVIGNGQFQTATFSGSGTLAAYSATEVPNAVEFTLAAPANASVTKVMNGSVELTAPFSVKPGTTVTVTYTANEGYLFSTGATTMDKSITVSEAGEQPAPSGTDTTKGKAKIGTTYYLTLNAAIDAAAANATIELCEDAAVEGEKTIATSLTLQVAGKTLTVASPLTVVSGTTVKIVNSGCLAPALTGSTGTVLIGDVITVNGTIDLSALPVGAVYGGIVPTTASASVAIANGAKAIFYAWDAAQEDSANWMYGNYPAFFGGVVPNGGLVQIGTKIWKGNGTRFVRVDGEGTVIEVATATLTGTHNPVADPATFDYTESFAALADALSAANEVTLTAAQTIAADTTIAAAKTVDIGAASLTIAAGQTLTVAGTLKCDASGSNFINNGTLVLAAGSAVYMGANKWFGDGSVFANVTAGTLSQTRSVTPPPYGNVYVISENGAATIANNETLFDAYDDQYVLSAGSTLTTALPSAKVLAKTVSGVTGYRVAELSTGVYGLELDTIAFTLAAPLNASVQKVMAGEQELTAPYAVVAGTEITVTYKANEGYLFANGTDEIAKTFAVNAAGEQPAPSGTETEAGKVKIGTTYYLTFDAAATAAEATGGKIEVLANGTFAKSFVFTNDVEISVLANVTLTREGTANYPFTVDAGATLTFSGEGTISKGDATACGSSTLVSVGKSDDETDIKKGGKVVIADCGIKLVDQGGSNTISIDCGELVMNGGTIENGNASGHAIRVSSKVTGGEAAKITVNKGYLKAVAAPIGVKGDSSVITSAGDGWYLATGTRSTDKFYGLIKVPLTNAVKYSNNLSDFAPVGYEYVKDAVETDWYVIAIKTFQVEVEGGSVDGDATFYVTNDYPKAFALVKGTAPEGKTFKEWTTTAGTISGDTLTLATFPNANVSVTSVWEMASTPITPGGDGKPYDTKPEAEAATNNFVVAIDPIVDAKLTDAASKATYKAMFKPVIVEEGGKFVVKADFTDQAKADIQTAVDTATKAIEISEVASAAGASDIEIANSIPGLYYQLNTASELTPASFEIADEQLGDGDTITFKSVAKPSATKGFYKVSVTAAAQITNE